MFVVNEGNYTIHGSSGVYINRYFLKVVSLWRKTVAGYCSSTANRMYQTLNCVALHGLGGANLAFFHMFSQ